MSQPSFKVAFQLTFQRLSTASRREGSEMITSTKQQKLSGLMMLHLEKNVEKLLSHNPPNNQFNLSLPI